jgi:hypothetical protein
MDQHPIQGEWMLDGISYGTDELFGLGNSPVGLNLELTWI